jgi:two-component system cell cycle sensor histidine kinase/response regulator CckA
LATVYGIVKQNNGTISVHSELNVGTMFKVYFPRVTEELDAVRKDKTSEIPVGTETVLLVEDEDMVRGLAKRILERRGYNVIEMDNGGKAFVYCSEHDEQIDLLFTDVVMPGINGWDLYNQLRKKRPSLKAVFMSGYMENVTVHHGVLDEGVHFIQKPFTIEELTVTVRKALDGEA